MRISRFVLAASLVLAAACGRDAATPLATPGGPAASTWTRTYQISAVTLAGGRFNWTPQPWSGGYVKVDLVPDNPQMGWYELGTVQADGDALSFYKPANNSIRLTAIPTVAGCTFHGWVFGTSSSTTTSVNPVNMDNYHPWYQAKAEFRCV